MGTKPSVGKDEYHEPRKSFGQTHHGRHGHCDGRIWTAHADQCCRQGRFSDGYPGLPKDDLASAGKGLFLTLSGGFFLITAIRLTIASRKQKQLYDELLALNSRVTGTVTEVRTDYSVRINHRYARIAMVRCPFPRGEVILKSIRLWNIVPAVGDTVDVLFDPMDESRYIIDFMDK